MKDTKKPSEMMPRWKRLLRYHVWRLSKAMHLSEKASAANEWGCKNPIYLFSGVIGILAICTALSVTALVASIYPMSDSIKVTPKEVSDSELVSGFLDIQPMMDGLHTIENGKKREKMEVKALVDRGLVIKREIDSLQRLPMMTRDDSLRLAANYRHLKDIVDFLDKRKNP